MKFIDSLFIRLPIKSDFLHKENNCRESQNYQFLAKKINKKLINNKFKKSKRGIGNFLIINYL